MQNNKNLQTAKVEKNDEFYTRIEDVETELQHYTKHFSGKVVYCNFSGCIIVCSHFLCFFGDVFVSEIAFR